MDANTAFELVAMVNVAVDHALHRDLALDDTLMDSFPASDPISSFNFSTPPALLPL